MIKNFLRIFVSAAIFTGSNLTIHQALAVENMKNNIKPVETNMHTLQAMVETHGVDWKGLYPNNLIELKGQASIKDSKYWKSLINPFTQKKDIGESMIDIKIYNNSKNNHESLKGSVIYQPLDCQENKTEKRSLCKNYKIYGLDEDGNVIQDKNEDFYLRITKKITW